jgi:hypothetical protein
MAHAYSDLRFVPVKWTILPDEWYVLVTFPDGKELPINGVFRTKAEAHKWIETSSTQWFQEHSVRQPFRRATKRET